MQKLSPEKQYLVSKETLRPILSQYDLYEFSFELISGGIENTSIRIESNSKRYVLRVYRRGNKKDEEITFELTFQDYLRNNGIPVPIVYKNRQGAELSVYENTSARWQAILMEFVEGTSNTPYTPELVDELSELQARMHLLGMEFAKGQPKGTKWKRLHLELVPPVDVKKQSAELQRFIKRNADFSYPLDADLPYGYNHCDFDLDGNVIVKDNRISGVIDFEDVTYSPVVDCLAKTLWSVLFDGNEEYTWRYLRNYQKIRLLTQKEKNVLPHAIQCRNYAITAMNLLTGLYPDSISKHVEYEKKIPEIFKDFS